MNHFSLRFVFVALALAFLAVGIMPARADRTNIDAIVTFTNVTSGFTNGQTITVNGSVRTATNNITASPSTKIQATNTVGWAATNTWLHLSTYAPTIIDRVFATNTNSIVIRGALDATLTVTLSANVGTVVYAPVIWASMKPIVGPNGAVPTAAGRTNNASLLIELLNDTRQSNAVNNGVAALSNLVDRISQQTASNKVWYATTNRGGAMENIQYFRGTNIAATNVTLYLVAIDGGTYAGLITSLTNGTLYSNAMHYSRITNAFGLHGTVFAFTDGLYTNATLDRAKSTNLINYGNALRSDGPGANSFQSGSNAWALGLRSVAIGSNAFSTNDDTVAIGTSAKATNTSATALGNGSVAGGAYTFAGGYSALATNTSATALGAFAYASGAQSSAIGNLTIASGTGSTAVGSEDTRAFGPYSFAAGAGAYAAGWGGISIGFYAINSYSNSVAIGYSATTTTTNQIRLGTSAETVSIPGTLQAIAVASLATTATSTNQINGSVSYSSSSISTVAAGHNIIDIGTNTIAYLTGAPGVAWTLGGIVGDIRPNRVCTVVNQTGYDVTVWNEDGLVPTAAQRILTLATASGTNVALVGNGFLRFIYSSASARWLLDSDLGDVTASTTNGVINNLLTNAEDYVTLKVYGSEFLSTNLWVTGAISGASLSVVDFYANSMTLTNPLGSNVVRLGVQDLTNSVAVSPTDGDLFSWNAGMKKWTNTAVSRVGSYRTIYADSACMISNSTAGASFGTEETSGPTNRMVDSYTFSGTVTNTASFKVAMPLEWDLSTVKVKLWTWSTNNIATTTNVWGISASAIKTTSVVTNIDWGTELTITNTVSSAGGQALLTPATPALTVGNSPASAGQLVWVRIRRLPGHTSDNDGGGQKLLGAWLQYKESTTEAASW